MKSLRIALDARLVGTSATGDATYWRGLIHGLSQLDVDTRFLLCSNVDKPAIVPEHPNFEWLRITGSNSRWWSLVSFPNASRKWGADLIHTQYNLSPLCGRKGVTTVHDVSFRIEPSWFRWKDRTLLGSFVGSSIRRAAMVLTVSNTSANDIERFYPAARSKLRATPLACGLGVQEVEKERAQQLVREIGIDRPYLLTVGTRWPRKNMELALAAAEALPDSIPHAMVVTGKSGWGDQSARSRTIATGFVSDETLSALYQCADLYLAPSRYEGFGLTLLEAFSLGCPVLCSDGGAHPEVAGSAARVMTSRDAVEWSRAIQELVQDSSTLEAMRVRGRLRASEFHWKKTAMATHNAYLEAIR